MTKILIKHILFLFSLVIALTNCNPDNFENPDPGIVYFMVSEYPTFNKGDSYILPLSDPVEIQKAREIIANPQDHTDRIVVAKIERQPDNLLIKNKNLLQNITWSWRIVEFQGFAGTTIEIIDGSPTIVEEDIEFWFQNTANSNDFGSIGFWGYTVKKEVQPNELK